MEQIMSVASIVHGIVWGPGTLALILFTGLYFSIGSRFFQIRCSPLWLKKTLFAICGDKGVRASSKNTLSQLQTLSTALAGTIGTGSIVGVATAISTGGAGAVFWMWVSAILGMMTKYAENLLGNRYRYKKSDGTWMGGPMVYMERGLHCKPLAVVFAVCCALSAFGIGNLTQANSIAGALEASFDIPLHITGTCLTIVTGVVLYGGISRAASFAERFVPWMTLFFLSGGIFILFRFHAELPAAFSAIFRGAFGLDAVYGGVGGYAVFRMISVGIARGIFSNEAGLGSSVIINSTSNVKDPVQQGMWGIFEVFVSTLVICTISALVFLTTSSTHMEGTQMAVAAFTKGLGQFGGIFLTISLVCFAFSSILGWSCYGEKSVEYLFGKRWTLVYRVVFVLVIGVGCVAQLNIVWMISDTFNGFMALPNLFAILFLSKEVLALTNKPKP